MALISKVDRVSRVFQQEWKTWCCDKIEEVKVSQLSQEDQDNFWRRDAELHPSSFPFCGLRDAYERLTRSEDPVVQQNFSSDFYLNCGTVTHTASQNWLGKSKRLIGTWICEACGNTRAFGPRPKVCRCGSVRIKYEELGGVDGEISWHTDGLFFYNGEYWLIDFKTSSTYAIEKANEARKQGKKADLPYAKNVFQIESYTVLVERKYNIKITGWLLVYCFHPDTLVVTESGMVRIEDLVASPTSCGRVLSFNHSTGEAEYKPVTAATKRPASKRMVEIEYEGGVLRVTEDHPIWSSTRNQYIAAIELTDEDEILLARP